MIRFSVFALALIPSLVAAAEPRILPPAVELVGPNGSQQLLLVIGDGERVVADRTREARFQSSDPKIAAIDADGVVRAKGNGQAVISASVDGKVAKIEVKVARFAEPAPWDFRNHIIPVLTRAGCNSGACHGALAGKGGLKLSLRGYDPDTDHFVLTRQAAGRRVDRIQPADSLLLQKPTRALPHTGGKLFETDSAEYRRIVEWIAEGAQASRADSSTLSRLEVFPQSARLQPKDVLRTVVRAWYSDGHAEDVTPWARFSSSEEPVVAVDEAGKVTVAGPGEAAVNVQFGSLVASAKVQVPFDRQVDPRLYADSPKQNAIDDAILKKLETLNIPPSPQCTDREFVRRAYLDAIGTLPTPAEVEAFVRDSAPAKRSRLIDELLARPEYIDYWTYKWSDVLLVSSRKLSQSQMWSYFRFIRNAVAENRSWDRFARDILTAQGGALTNGAANYFLLHRDVAELTETTAVTFLGMSVACAKCHNHPLEKWTQDQYWSLANLFGRVTQKNGDRGGDVIVQSLPAGDVSHPRRRAPMPPTPLDGKPWTEESGDRRAYLADWVASPGNPFFAKALVNRVWRNFMGRGLVEAEDDLRQTNPPTHPELFDELARDFVKQGYDVKWLVRAIMTSAAYQRSSRPVPGNETDDRFYARYLVRRLPAEVLLDAMSQVTNVPTPFNQIRAGGGGPPQAATDLYPLGTRAQQLPDVQMISRFLDSFGRPAREQTCSCERNPDASVAQALHVANGATLNDKLSAKDSIISTWLAENRTDEQMIDDLFERALARRPSNDERTKLLATLKQARDDRRAAVEDLVWGVLVSREFAFNR